VKNVLFGSLVLLSLGCATQSQSPAPERPATTSRLLSPIRVTWEEVERTDTQAVVLAKIERLLALDLPFSVAVVLPEGVKAVEGRTLLTLLPNSEAVTVTERLVLAYDTAPLSDVVLKVDGETGAMGFHYLVPYRFGRPDPAENTVPATGPVLKKGDQVIGPSVPLK
jgi:hypothetical protein